MAASMLAPKLRSGEARVEYNEVWRGSRWKLVRVYGFDAGRLHEDLHDSVRGGCWTCVNPITAVVCCVLSPEMTCMYFHKRNVNKHAVEVANAQHLALGEEGVLLRVNAHRAPNALAGQGCCAVDVPEYDGALPYNTVALVSVGGDTSTLPGAAPSATNPARQTSKVLRVVTSGGQSLEIRGLRDPDAVISAVNAMRTKQDLPPTDGIVDFEVQVPNVDAMGDISMPPSLMQSAMMATVLPTRLFQQAKVMQAVHKQAAMATALQGQFQAPGQGGGDGGVGAGSQAMHGYQAQLAAAAVAAQSPATMQQMAQLQQQQLMLQQQQYHSGPTNSAQVFPTPQPLQQSGQSTTGTAIPSAPMFGASSQVAPTAQPSFASVHEPDPTGFGRSWDEMLGTGAPSGGSAYS